MDGTLILDIRLSATLICTDINNESSVNCNNQVNKYNKQCVGIIINNESSVGIIIKSIRAYEAVSALSAGIPFFINDDVARGEMS